MNWLGSASRRRSSRRVREARRGELARRDVERDVGPQADQRPLLRLLDRGVDDPVADRLDQAAALRGGDELAGRHEPDVGVAPAQQRLDRDGHAGRDRVHRLVVQLELVARQRPAQTRGERQLRGRRRVLGGVEAERPAAVALGLVERAVRALEQLLEVAGVVREDRDADARRDLELVPLEHERLLERGQQVTRDDPGLLAGVALEVAEQQHELVAAVAGQHVLGACAGGEPPRDLAQQLVAGAVAERVVDHLEVIEVDVEQRDGAIVPSRAGQRVDQVLVELGAVGQPGQRVVVGHVGDALLRRELLGHVVADDQHRAVDEPVVPADPPQLAAGGDDVALEAIVAVGLAGEYGLEAGTAYRRLLGGYREAEPVAAGDRGLVVLEHRAGAGVDLLDRAARPEHDDHRSREVEVALRAAMLGVDLGAPARAARRLSDAHRGGEAERQQREDEVAGGLVARGARDARGGQHHHADRRRPRDRVGDRGEHERQHEGDEQRRARAALEHHAGADRDRHRGAPGEEERLALARGDDPPARQGQHPGAQQRPHDADGGERGAMPAVRRQGEVDEHCDPGQDREHAADQHVARAVRDLVGVVEGVPHHTSFFGSNGRGAERCSQKEHAAAVRTCVVRHARARPAFARSRPAVV